MIKNFKETEGYKKELVDILMAMAKDKKELADFLVDLLTPAELSEIATRWQIVKKLKKGEGQRDIAGDLHIGLATVNRGSRTLLNPSGGFNQALRKSR